MSKTKMDASEFGVKVEEDIEGDRYSWGAVFRLKGWGVHEGQSPESVQIGVTNHDAAAMLLFASGSLEDAIDALAYASKMARKEEEK